MVTTLGRNNSVSWESLHILHFFLFILPFSPIERSLSLILIWFQGGWEGWQSCFMARKHTTLLGCLLSVSKQNTQSYLSHKLHVASWNTNVIITVQLIAAKAHLKIITAFHLNWIVTLLKCIFLLNYFFVRGKINGGRKWKEFGKKILELKSYWSLTVRSQFFSMRLSGGTGGAKTTAGLSRGARLPWM